MGIFNEKGGVRMKGISKSVSVTSTIVRSLHQHNKTIFTVADVQEIIPLGRESVYKIMSQLRKKGMIDSIKPGKYILLPSHVEGGPYIENVWIVGQELVESKEYFFSHSSAMDLHDMLARPTNEIYITTPKRQSEKKISNFTFHFICTKEANIWGIEETWVSQSDKVRCSDLERTILDCLQRPALCGGIVEISGGIWKQKDKLSSEKLIEYVERLGKDVVAKRLGFILEALNISRRITVPFLRQYISKKPKYYLLDPTRSSDKKVKNSWRLIANVSPEELLAMTEV
ncbi:TPA: hypothetical protein EYP70_03545 [Candidatus Bathyarchaeota archaeon]|nr:hypothetical protein [Candidatus Bathyarchaeota archaeon]